MLSKEIDEDMARQIRAIDPVNGLRIAEDLRRGRTSYRRLAKKYKVGFTTIRDIKKIVFYSADVAGSSTISLTGQNFENEGEEKPDALLVSILYEISRYSGVLSKTQAAVWVRDVVRKILPLSLKYGADPVNEDPVEAILDGVRAETRKDAWAEALRYCQENNHPLLREKYIAEGRQIGRAQAEQIRDQSILENAKNGAIEHFLRQGLIPLNVGISMSHMLTHMERDRLESCPYCHEILTVETSEPVGPLTKVPPPKRMKFLKLRARKREETGGVDPEPNYYDPMTWAGLAYAPVSPSSFLES